MSINVVDAAYDRMEEIGVRMSNSIMNKVIEALRDEMVVVHVRGHKHLYKFPSGTSLEVALRIVDKEKKLEWV